MKNTSKTKKKINPLRVYEVRSFVRARDAFEARKLSKSQEPHEITLLRASTVENHASYVDAIGYLETPPEWDEEEVPLEDNKIGFHEKSR